MSSSFLSRDSQPLKPLAKPTPNLWKPTLTILFILAFVSFIFVVVAHFVPGLQLVIILPAILLAFAFIAVCSRIRYRQGA